MSLVIGVPKEVAPGEKRVASVPEVVKKFKALGAEICMETGAGAGSLFRDEDFGATSIAADSGPAVPAGTVRWQNWQAVRYTERRKPGTAALRQAFIAVSAPAGPPAPAA